MRWKVQLKGHELGLSDLSNSFRDDPKIFEEDGDYFIWSSRFGELDNYIDVLEETEVIIQNIRNFGRIDSLRVEELEAELVYELLDDGSEHIYLVASGDSVGVKLGPRRVLDADGNELEEFLPANRTYERTQVALRDDRVTELSQMLERGDSWVNLYRIYEHIEDNIKGDENIIELGWWEKKEKRLFKHTANSREAIGNKARHGKETIPAPSDPMDYHEAKQLIETLIDHWITYRQELDSNES